MAQLPGNYFCSNVITLKILLRSYLKMNDFIAAWSCFENLFHTKREEVKDHHIKLLLQLCEHQNTPEEAISKVESLLEKLDELKHFPQYEIRKVIRTILEMYGKFGEIQKVDALYKRYAKILPSKVTFDESFGYFLAA